MNQRMTKVMFAAIGLVFSAAASAVPMVLDDSTRCGAGNAANGIAVGDVSGNAGGASECWGAFAGNDPGPSGDGFDIGGVIFEFVAKEDTPGGLEGMDIGLDVSPDGGAGSGTWAFDDSLFSPDAFLIVLKAANNPGFGVWLFEGDDAASDMGDWLVAWGKDLSHLSIYASGANGVPEPGTMVLLGLGLLGMGLARRRVRSS